MPRPGEMWHHYRGGLYRVVGVGLDTATQRAVVIYETWNPRHSAPLYTRLLDEFLGSTDDREPRFSQTGRSGIKEVA